MIERRRQSLKFVPAVAQMQSDFSAAARPCRHFDAEVAFAARFPFHAMLRGQPGATGNQRNLVGDDERRIEIRRRTGRSDWHPFFASPVRLSKNALVPDLAMGARYCRSHFLPARADAIVGDGNGACRRIEIDADFPVRCRSRSMPDRQLLQSAACRGHQEAFETSSRRKISLVAVQGGSSTATVA